MRIPIYIAAALAVMTAGCLSPLVGAECADSYESCAGTCVDTSSDPDNCGGCGIACDGVCVNGVCPGGPRQGDAGVMPDGGTGDGGTSTGDGGTSTGDGGTSTGDGGTSTGDGGTSTSDGGGGCGTGLQSCSGSCVDTSSDPDHCGSCGIVCTSGLCMAGMCQDVVSGHIVAIGHDYLKSHAGMARLVGNAVFLAAGAPVRVLTYRGGATRASIKGTNAAIDQVATELGRSWETFDGSSATVPALLGSAEVFLIYAQKGGTDASLTALGQAWGPALDGFLSGGGIVILLDGPATHAGTFQILKAAGVADLGGRHDVTAPILMVTSPTDAVARNVPPAYGYEKDTVAFDKSVGTTVTSDGTSPVVVHELYY